MDLRINLNQQQVQKPIITIMMSPQMQQAIQLLQLPLLELQQRIEQELAQNPGNKSYVAEYQGKIVGYMITYLLSIF